LSISCEIENKYLASKTMNNIGQVYFEQGKHDAALDKFQQSLVIDRKISDRKGEGITLNNMGKVYEAKGDYTVALKQYEQALVIAKEIGEKDGEATYSGNIGVLYAKQGELAKAEPYISRTVELMEQLEHPMLENVRKVLEAVRAKLRVAAAMETKHERNTP
jgi:tetratricopeptide (TPR) repeat protein